MRFTYEEWVEQLEARPAGMSPLRWMAHSGLCGAPFSEWMLRWLRGQRAVA